VVQDVELFEPSAEEMATAEEKVAELEREKLFPIHLDATKCDASTIQKLKGLFEDYPGDTSVVVHMRTSEGRRSLRFGEAWNITPSAGFRAELDEMVGPVAVAA
jgi:hypothetical protein